ncbi:hypothetical protein [Allochromatium vinosum]|uniref:hypothetical protein n=1 Tax=Allochromatium vinosum TaxID=1049 RepID=UPI0011D0A53C|nr:hypothetical protein [Allochromatium vinosum]
MNEIGLSGSMPSTGATRAYTPPRVDSGSESTPATPGVTTSTPDRGSSSIPSTQTVGSASETISISSDAYRLQQAGASTTEAVDSASDTGLNSEQAMALAQSARDAMTQNPPLAFQAQSGQISAQQVASVLRA